MLMSLQVVADADAWMTMNTILTWMVGAAPQAAQAWTNNTMMDSIGTSSLDWSLQAQWSTWMALMCLAFGVVIIETTGAFMDLVSQFTNQKSVAIASWVLGEFLYHARCHAAGARRHWYKMQHHQHQSVERSALVKKNWPRQSHATLSRVLVSIIQNVFRCEACL